MKNTRDCNHRWTRNNLCSVPGCRAFRRPDQPLKPGERFNADYTRNRAGSAPIDRS